MVAGKIHHWKHGWIPLDAPTARTDALQEIAPEEKPDPIIMPVLKQDHLLLEGVDGAPNVTINSSDHRGLKPLANTEGFSWAAPSHWPNDHSKVVVAKAAQEVYDRFPGLGKRHGIESFIPVMSRDDFFAATPNGSDPSPIAVDVALFKEGHVTRVRKEQLQDHMGIADEAPTNEDYQRRVIIHEMGHVLHMLAEADHGQSNPIDELANEPTTPREGGFTEVGGGASLDDRFPRWMVDSLRAPDGTPHSTYSSGNQYEWYAEAFADGLINGDKATPSGKRAIAAADKLYGKGTNPVDPLQGMSQEYGWAT